MHIPFYLEQWKRKILKKHKLHMLFLFVCWKSYKQESRAIPFGVSYQHVQNICLKLWNYVGDIIYACCCQVQFLSVCKHKFVCRGAAREQFKVTLIFILIIFKIYNFIVKFKLFYTLLIYIKINTIHILKYIYINKNYWIIFCCWLTFTIVTQIMKVYW